MQEFLTKGLITSANMPLFIVGIALCVIIPYLLGSLNFGVIISKLRYRDDVRTHGSGNAGMTNMLRTYGKSAAIITLLGDILKAVVWYCHYRTYRCAIASHCILQQISE